MRLELCHLFYLERERTPSRSGQEEVDLGDSFHTNATILDKFCPADAKDWMKLDRVERVHRRYLLGTLCESILTFRSRKELVSGFIDWVEGTAFFHLSFQHSDCEQ